MGDYHVLDQQSLGKTLAKKQKKKHMSEKQAERLSDSLLFFFPHGPLLVG
jgi:hypothetical protein